MSRTLHAAVAAATVGSTVKLAEMAEFAFPSGTLRTTTSPRDITWNGLVYSANALLVGSSGISENIDFKPRRVTFQLAGGFAAALNAVNTDQYHFCSATFYQAFLDDSDNLLGDPVALGDSLQMSYAVITASEDALTIDLSVEGLEILASRDSANLASNVAQQRRYPGDTGMIYAEVIPTFELTWGGGVTRMRDGDKGDRYEPAPFVGGRTP
jgi:hypothetical protein